MTQRPWPFPSVMDAVSWAERLLKTPPLGSQLGVYVGTTPPASDLGTAREVAMTISVAVANIDNGSAIRAVYGDDGIHLQELSQKLASETWSGPEEGQTIAIARVLAVHVLNDYRRRVKGRPKLSVKQAAANMGISRATFYRRSWAETEERMRETLDLWLRQGESALSERLAAVGIV